MSFFENKLTWQNIFAMLFIIFIIGLLLYAANSPLWLCLCGGIVALVFTVYNNRENKEYDR